MIRTALVLVLLGTFAVPMTGCGEQTKKDLQKVGEGLGQTWDAVKTFAVNRKDEAVAFFSKEMAEAPEKYAEARLEVEKVGADAKAALDAKWKDVETTFEAAKTATGDGWAKARDAAYDAFRAELDKTR